MGYLPLYVIDFLYTSVREWCDPYLQINFVMDAMEFIVMDYLPLFVG